MTDAPRSLGCRSQRLLALAGVVLLAAGARAAGAEEGILFVDDDAAPGGDGLSWTGAFTHLQDALAVARDATEDVTEIRIAGGVHRPDRSAAEPEGSGDRFASFWVVDGVAVVGGYAGLGADDPDERDVNGHETILSGDLAGDDAPGFAGYAENTLHVVIAQDLVRGTSRLEGVTITSGHTGGAGCCRRGAGMRTARADLVLRDCTFTANLGAGLPGGEGGGLYLATSTATIERCRFEGNDAVAGGGLYVRGSDAVLVDCVIAGNTAGNAGGAATFESGAVAFEGCLFADNQADVSAGGLRVQGSGPTTLTGCTFAGNGSAEKAGGLQITHTTTLVGCDFAENAAPIGAAVHNWPIRDVESEAVLEACTFRDHPFGGVVFNDGQFDGLPIARLTNCLVFRNDTPGLVNWNGGVALVTNCTFADNERAVFNTFDDDVTDIVNSILWNETRYAGNEQIVGGTVSLRSSCVRWLAEGLRDKGNTNEDPRFRDAAAADYRLGPASPSLDTGLNIAVPGHVTTDLDGVSRFVRRPVAGGSTYEPCPPVDMGAYERQGGTSHCCPGDVDGDGLVAFADLLAVLNAWGDPGGPADVDGSGHVDFEDLLAVLAAWGPCA